MRNPADDARARNKLIDSVTRMHESYKRNKLTFPNYNGAAFAKFQKTVRDNRLDQVFPGVR